MAAPGALALELEVGAEEEEVGLEVGPRLELELERGSAVSPTSEQRDRAKLTATREMRSPVDFLLKARKFTV